MTSLCTADWGTVRGSVLVRRQEKFKRRLGLEEQEGWSEDSLARCDPTG